VKVLGVIIGTSLIILMSLGAIYFWGVGQVFPKFDHPFFEAKKPWIVVPRSLEQEIESHPEDIVWLEVFRDSHGTLVVDKIDSGINLTDVLAQLSSHRIVLNVKSNVEDIDRQLAELLPKFLKTTPILLQSEYDIILRSTKESLANIPYGASQSDRLRLNSYEGMAPWSAGLLPAAPFHGDVYVTALKWKNVPLVDELVAREIHRRQKYLLIGPITNLDELHQAQGLAPDGFYITDANLIALLRPQAVAH